MVYIEGMGDPHLLIEAIHKDLPLFIEFPYQSPEERMRMLKELTITMGKVGKPEPIKRLKKTVVREHDRLHGWNIHLALCGY